MANDDDIQERDTRAATIWAKARIAGFAAVVASIGLTLWARSTLSGVAQVPVHWDAFGHANRWASGREAVGVLVMMSAGMLIFTLLMDFLRQGPRREALAATPGIFALGWLGTLCVLLAAQIAIVAGARDPMLGFRVVSFTVCAFLILLGNYLGKTRPNWWIGVRTPWSLSSERSWAKSNRLAGRTFVLAGAGGLLALVAGRPEWAALILVIGAVGGALAAIFVSWLEWRADPARQN